MLVPKRMKYRKAHRGRMDGKETRGVEVSFGEYALQALEPAWITSRQIEAARRAITRSVRRRETEASALIEESMRRIWVMGCPLRVVTGTCVAARGM